MILFGYTRNAAIPASPVWLRCHDTGRLHVPPLSRKRTLTHRQCGQLLQLEQLYEQRGHQMFKELFLM